MGPSDLPPLPYTVSSPGWNILTSYVRYLDEIDDHSVDDRLQSVLYVWGRVYTVSKIVTMALMHYGVDVRDDPTSQIQILIAPGLIARRDTGQHHGSFETRRRPGPNQLN